MTTDQDPRDLEPVDSDGAFFGFLGATIALLVCSGVLLVVVSRPW